MNFNPSRNEPSAQRFPAHPGATPQPGRPAPDRAPHRVPAGARLRQRATDERGGPSTCRSATHRALDIWQREAADRIGVARVTGQEVLTALIDQLLIDPKLSAEIIRAIQDRR